MDVRLVPGVHADLPTRLRSAGIETVEDLRAADPADVAAGAGLSVEEATRLVASARATRIPTDLPGLTPTAARRLFEAGVPDLDALLARDAAELGAASGLGADRVRRWQEAARAAAPPPELASPGAVRDALEDMRVVLAERAGRARVRLAGVWHEDVPIVVARAGESADRVLEGLASDAVVLRAKAEDALVRLGEDVFEHVPIFKEKLVAAADGASRALAEVRVRVEEIRERRS